MVPIPPPASRLSRRGFLGLVAPAAALGLLAPARRILVFAGEPALVETPSDDEGPFYRTGAPDRDDLRVKDADAPSLTVSGLVRAEDGKPLSGVLLDLWHAGPKGAYDVRSKDYLWRGRVKTDAEGRYRFATDWPGRYRFGDASMRPRHVHVKFSGEGLWPLTTQMYFEVKPTEEPEELIVAVQWKGEGKSRAGTGTWNPILSRRAPTPPAK